MQRIDEFENEIKNSKSKEDVFNALKKHVNSLGIEWFTILVLHAPTGRECLEDFSTYPKEWVARYKEQKYIRFDKIGHHALRTFKAFTWDEIAKPEDLTDEQRLLFNEAKEFGLISGGALPLHGPNLDKALFSVASHMEALEFKEFFAARQHELHIVSACVYGKLYDLGYFAPMDTGRDLTDRERQIVAWTAKGKTASEVAKIIEKSPHTVKHHVRNVEYKLQAMNTAHAVYTAVVHGLITPLDDM